MPFQRTLGRLMQVSGLAGREEGQALVEYALLIALISIIAIGAVQAFGLGVSTLYQSIVNAVP
jgi:pilus assembly protein Flp/PilA